MAKNKLLNAESGIAHVGLILVVMLVLGLTGFAAYKVVTSNQVAQEQDDTSQLVEAEDEAEKQFEGTDTSSDPSSEIAQSNEEDNGVDEDAN